MYIKDDEINKYFNKCIKEENLFEYKKDYI